MSGATEKVLEHGMRVFHSQTVDLYVFPTWDGMFERDITAGTNSKRVYV